MPYKDIEMRRAVSRTHYYRNKEAYLARRRQTKPATVAALIALVIEVKRKPCVDCKKEYPHYVMEFDHLPEFEKIAAVSRLVRDGSRLKVLAEMEKCEVVCANCHRERTWARKHPDERVEMELQ